MKSKYWVPLLAACAVSIPTLSSGVVLDDWTQRAMVRGNLNAEWWDLFSFGGSSPEQTRAMVQEGALPWYTAPDLRLRFFRPLSSLLIVVDTKLFGDTIWPMHLHSVLWYLALTAVAAAFFRRQVPKVAWLAALLFAVDDAHTVPVSWLANRNAVVAVLSSSSGSTRTCAGTRGGGRAAPGSRPSPTRWGMSSPTRSWAEGRQETWQAQARARALLPAAATLTVFAVIYPLVGAAASPSWLGGWPGDVGRQRPGRSSGR